MEKLDKDRNVTQEYLDYVSSLKREDLETFYIGADLLVDRLNKIINELEKYTKEEIKKWKEEEKIENDYSTRANILGYITGMENIQDKIKELKGVDKE